MKYLKKINNRIKERNTKASFVNSKGIIYSSNENLHITTTKVIFKNNEIGGIRDKNHNYINTDDIQSTDILDFYFYKGDSIDDYTNDGISNTLLYISNYAESIKDNAFNNSKNLNYCLFTSDTYSNVNTFGNNILSNCSYLQWLVLPLKLTIIPNNCFENDINLKYVKYYDNIEKILDYAFYNCELLTNFSYVYVNTSKGIVIPNKIKYIGDYAFYNCNSIKLLTFENEKFPSIFDNTFGNDDNDYSNITIRYPYGYDINNYYINLFDNDKSKCKFLTYCKKEAYYKDLDFSKWPETNKIYYTANSKPLLASENLRSPNIVLTNIIGHSFENGKGCILFYNPLIKLFKNNIDIFGPDVMSINSITLPDSLTTIYSNSFIYCYGLETLTIPDSVTYIDDNTFENCISLISPIYNNSKTSLWYYGKIDENGTLEISNTVTKIENYAFYNCTDLETIIIPDSVVSIGEHCFDGCINLKEIVLGKNLIYIGNYAFNNCGSVYSITDYTDNIPTVFEYTFGIKDNYTGYHSNTTNILYTTYNKKDTYRSYWILSLLSSLMCNFNIEYIDYDKKDYTDITNNIFIDNEYLVLNGVTVRYNSTLKELIIYDINNNYRSIDEILELFVESIYANTDNINYNEITDNISVNNTYLILKDLVTNYGNDNNELTIYNVDNEYDDLEELLSLLINASSGQIDNNDEDIDEDDTGSSEPSSGKYYAKYNNQTLDINKEYSSYDESDNILKLDNVTYDYDEDTDKLTIYFDGIDDYTLQLNSDDFIYDDDTNTLVLNNAKYVYDEGTNKIIITFDDDLTDDNIIIDSTNINYDLEDNTLVFKDVTYDEENGKLTIYFNKGTTNEYSITLTTDDFTYDSDNSTLYLNNTNYIYDESTNRIIINSSKIPTTLEITQYFDDDDVDTLFVFMLTTANTSGTLYYAQYKDPDECLYPQKVKEGSDNIIIVGDNCKQGSADVIPEFNAGVNTFKYKFIPNDSNYETISGTFNINIIKIKSEIKAENMTFENTDDWYFKVSVDISGKLYYGDENVSETNNYGCINVKSNKYYQLDINNLPDYNITVGIANNLYYLLIPTDLDKYEISDITKGTIMINQSLSSSNLSFGNLLSLLQSNNSEYDNESGTLIIKNTKKTDSSIQLELY